MSSARTLISDLGGVLIEFSFRRAYRVWAAYVGLSADEVAGRFVWDGAYLDYERGRISTAAFVDHLAAAGIAIDEQVFDEGWRRVFTGTDADTLALLEQLSRRGVPMVALTNTNAAHVPVWSRRFAGALDVFDAVYASSEIGARKPEPEAFRHVLDELGLAPADAVFVDDTAYCVEGARALGIESYLFTTAEQLRRDLAAAGFPV